MGSKRYHLDAIDARKMQVSFGLGLCGFLSAWFAKELAPALREEGTTVALLIAAAVPVLINGARKWLTDNRRKQ